MAVYAIGDVQGCFAALRALLEKTAFNADRDRLWFVGDLVNRGPENLHTLRFIRSLGDGAVTVLGNHDLHLLAIAYGHREIHHKEDTLDDVVHAPDFAELVDWLRNRPLLHHDETLGYVMVHAGLPPQWNLACAREYADEVQQVLRSDMIDDFLPNMYGNEPRLWSNDLEGWDRLRCITNSLTRIRYCELDGSQDFRNNREPGSQPAHLHPWFRLPNRRSKDIKIVFGHWAALGQHQEQNVHALDSGCVWGGKLTALRLDDEPGYFQVSCGHG